MARTVEISCFAVPLLVEKGGGEKNLESVFSTESNKRVWVETTHSERQSTNVGIPKGEEPQTTPHRGGHESQQLKS